MHRTSRVCLCRIKNYYNNLSRLQRNLLHSATTNERTGRNNFNPLLLLFIQLSYRNTIVLNKSQESFWAVTNVPHSSIAGNSIYQFLQRALEQLRKEFNELRAATADHLVYIKEDLIIPHHNTFYDFIVNKVCLLSVI